MRRAVISLTVLAALAACAQRVAAQAADARGFARLKSLVGEWEGKDDKGASIHATFTLIAGDSVLLELDRFADGSTAAAAYYADITRVELTYFSTANNQPRMSADPSVGDPSQLDFSFVGATNLHSPQIGHMHHLLLRLDDRDHFTAMWTWRHYDRDEKLTYRFARKI